MCTHKCTHLCMVAWFVLIVWHQLFIRFVVKTRYVLKDLNTSSSHWKFGIANILNTIGCCVIFTFVNDVLCCNQMSNKILSSVVG